MSHAGVVQTTFFMTTTVQPPIENNMSLRDVRIADWLKRTNAND